MSAEEYEELKKSAAFIKRAALITGKVWRWDYVGYYFNGIDCDNLKAIEEICSYNGNAITVQQLTFTPNIHSRTISATVTVLTKSRRVYDPDERWTTQKDIDELILNPPNGVKGKWTVWRRVN
jgi:hypothetical protein